MNGILPDAGGAANTGPTQWVENRVVRMRWDAVGNGYIVETDVGVGVLGRYFRFVEERSPGGNYVEYE